MKSCLVIRIASLALLVGFAAGCSSEEERHPPPDGVVVNCDPLPGPDAEGCHGAPLEKATESSPVYPQGCSATVTINGASHAAWCDPVPRVKDAGSDAEPAYQWMTYL